MPTALSNFPLLNSCSGLNSVPGKKVRRNPANPTWDPSRDFGTSHMGSHLESQVGSRQSHPGSQLHSRQNPAWDAASSPGWDPTNPTQDPTFVPSKIPPIPRSNLCLSQVGSRNLTWGHLFVTQTGSHLWSFLITHKSQFQLWNMSKLKWEGGKYHTWGPKAIPYTHNFFPTKKVLINQNTNT